MASLNPDDYFRDLDAPAKPASAPKASREVNPDDYFDALPPPPEPKGPGLMQRMKDKVMSLADAPAPVRTGPRHGGLRSEVQPYVAADPGKFLGPSGAQYGNQSLEAATQPGASVLDRPGMGGNGLSGTEGMPLSQQGATMARARADMPTVPTVDEQAGLERGTSVQARTNAQVGNEGRAADFKARTEGAAQFTEKTRSRSASEFGSDIAQAGLEGIGTAEQILANVAAPDSEWAATVKKTIEAIRADYTPQKQFQDLQRAEKLKGVDGEWQKAAVMLGELFSDPAFTIEEIVKQAPLMAGMIGATLAGGAVGAGAARVSMAAASRVAPTVALADAIGGGALTASAITAGGAAGTMAAGRVAGGFAAAGDAGSQVFDQLSDKQRTPDAILLDNADFKKVFQENLTRGMDGRQALDAARTTIATSRARLAQALAAPLGVFSGSVGLEKVLAYGIRGQAKSQVVKEVGGEVVEEIGTSGAGNVAARTVDPRQQLTEGFGEAGALALVTSAPLAGLTAYYSRAETPLPPIEARNSTLKRFDEAAAAWGLSPKAAEAVRAQAGAMPADDVPGFLARATAALNRRGLFRRPVDEAAVSDLDRRLRPADAAPAPQAPTAPEAPPPEADYTGLDTPQEQPDVTEPDLAAAAGVPAGAADGGSDPGVGSGLPVGSAADDAGRVGRPAGDPAPGSGEVAAVGNGRGPDAALTARTDAPGSDAGNGFKRGPVEGERYRVGVVDAVGGAVTLEKRLPAGTSSTFYVGKDGGLVDGDTVNLIGSGKERLWIPADAKQAEEAQSILDEMGRLALTDPARKAAKDRLKALVTTQAAVLPPKPAVGQTFDMDGKTWRVVAAADTAVSIADEKGNKRMIAKLGETWPRMIDALRKAAPAAPAPNAAAPVSTQAPAPTQPKTLKERREAARQDKGAAAGVVTWQRKPPRDGLPGSLVHRFTTTEGMDGQVLISPPGWRKGVKSFVVSFDRTGGPLDEKGRTKFYPTVDIGKYKTEEAARIAAEKVIAENRKATNAPAVNPPQAPPGEAPTPRAGAAAAAPAAVPGARAGGAVEAAGVAPASDQQVPPKRTEARRTAKHPQTVMGSRLLAQVSISLDGLHPSLLSEFSERFETARKDRYGRPMMQWRNPMIPGVGLLFRRSGTTDRSRIAQTLEDYGYLPPGTFERDYKEAGEQAKDLIRAALNREEVKTQDEIEADAIADQEAERQAYYAEVDAESAAELEAERAAIMAGDNLTTQELDALTDEDLFDGQGTTDTEAGMRAMGFTEQEIADELAKEAAAGAAKAGAQEDRQDEARGARPAAEDRGAAARPAGQEGLTLARGATELLAREPLTIPVTRAQSASPYAEHATGEYIVTVQQFSGGPGAIVYAVKTYRSGQQTATLTAEIPTAALESREFGKIEEAARALWERVSRAQESDLLTTQTPEDLKAKADREEAATKAAASKKAAEQERLRREAEARDNKARADATVDDFQLGQDATRQMSGMGDMFADEPAAAPAAAPVDSSPARDFNRARQLQQMEPSDPISEPDRELLGRVVDAQRAEVRAALEGGATFESIPLGFAQDGDLVIISKGGLRIASIAGRRSRENVLKALQETPAAPAAEPTGPTPNYAAGDRITPDKDVIEGDVVRYRGAEWMAKVKRGIGIPLFQMVDGKPQVSADTKKMVDVKANEVIHTGTNVYGYGGQPKPAEKFERDAPAPQAAAPEAAPGWHTPLPTQGEPSTQHDRTNAVNPKAPVDARKVSARLAAEAFAAITQAQQTNLAVSGMKLYPWVLPAQSNRNGVVRLLPEDQRPGAPWQQVGTEPVNAGGVRNLAINELAARLGREPIIGDEATAARDTFYESLIGRASTEQMSSSGGRTIYSVKITPLMASRQGIEFGRWPETESFALKRMADVTGRPADEGWALIDKREQAATRAAAEPGGDAALLAAGRLLLSQDTFGRLDSLAGDSRSGRRRDVMSALLGRKATLAESGITAVEREFYRRIGIEGGTIASQRDRFEQWVKSIDAPAAAEPVKAKEGATTNLNKPRAVPKKQALTPGGSLKADATNSRADSAVWYYQGDMGRLRFTASVTIDGKPDLGAAQAKELLAQIKAAQDAGWKRANYRAGSLGTVWVYERGDEFLTRAGMENAGSDVTAWPDIPSYGAGYDNMVRGQREFAAALDRWLNTLPADQQQNQGVVSRKMADVLGGWAGIERDNSGLWVRYYPRQDDGRRAVRWLHTIPASQTWEEARAKIAKMAGPTRTDDAGNVAMYEPAPPEYSDRYETDIFGKPLPQAARNAAAARPEQARVRRNAQPEPAVPGDTQAPAGQYRVRTTVGVTAQRRLGAKRIKTAADAAAATAYLYRSAVERFDAIVTDNDGRPLAVVGGFKGALSQASIYPSTIVGEAIRVPGAARIWFSHNHPSGSAVLSRADEYLNETMTSVFRGSGIEPMGMLAIGAGKYGFVGADGTHFGAFNNIPAPTTSPVAVPVVERELQGDDATLQPIGGPADAKDAAQKHYEAGGPGIILLNAQHQIVGWVPLAGTPMMGPLRNTGGLNAIYRAVSEANVGAAILVHGGEMDTAGNLPGGVTVGENIGAALSRVDVKALDIINAKTRRSAAEMGLATALGPVYSRAPQTERPDAWLYRFWSSRTWDSEADARDMMRRRIVEDNERYAGMFKPNDPALVDGLVFVKAPTPKSGYNKGKPQVKLKQPKAPPAPFARIGEPVDSEGSDRPRVDWESRDMADDGTPESVLQAYGRGHGNVYRAWVNPGDIPAPKGGGIKDGYPDMQGDYDWRELQQGRGSPPPLKLRVGKNGKLVLMDGNHRLAWWREQGVSEVPAYVIDERPQAMDVPFSRTVTPSRGLSLDEAEAIVGAVRDANPTAPLFVLMPTPSSLDKDRDGDLYAKIVSRGAVNDVEAAYHNGRIYVFYKHIASMERAMFVFAHHELRHHGMRSLEGKRLAAVLDSMVASNQKLRDAAQAKIDDDVAEDMIEGAEEALADMDVAEVQALKGWPKVLAAVRNWLRGMATRLRAKGHTTLADAIDPKDWTDADVAGFVARAEAVSKGGRAKFGTDGTVFNREDNPTWYSELARQIEKSAMNAAPATAWKQMLKGLTQRGVKADEIAWSGVEEWLKLQTGKVTKQQVADYLDSNGVKVTEVVLSDAPTGNQRDRDTLRELGISIEVNPEDPEMVAFTDTENPGDFMDADEIENAGYPERAVFAARRIENAGRNRTDNAKYGQYQLPGGTNYREVLLTLPTDESKYPKRRRAQLWENGELTAQGPVESAERWRTQFPRAEVRIVDLPDKQAAERAGNLYRSGHWDQPNVLAHIRLNDRTDASGARVLFVEEVQSDWGQDGKKRGFNRKATPQEVAREVYGQEFAAMDPTMQDGVMAEVEARNEGIGGAAGNGGGLVPNAPFVGKTDAWVALALKRVVKMAVDGGYDKVAFVTGEQSADRYDLSKQIDRIHYEKADDGRYELVAYKVGSRDDSTGSEVLHEDEIDLARIEALVGKEIAQKIADEAGESIGGPYRNWRELKGVDLKVGGEGMRAFYDKIVPGVAKDVLRKLGGGAMETVPMERDSHQGKPFVVTRDGGGIAGRPGFETREEAQRWIESQGRLIARELAIVEVQPRTQPGFTITAAMKGKALGGMPMFSRAPTTLAERRAAAPVARLNNVLRGAGWEVEYIDLDLTGDKPKADIRIKRDDGRFLIAKVDSIGRASFETFQRERNLRMDPKNPQSRLAPHIDDTFLGRQRFEGARSMLRTMTQYLTDNATGPVALADMRAAWAGVMSAPAKQETALPPPDEPPQLTLFSRAPRVTQDTHDGAPVFASDDITIAFPQDTERFEVIPQRGERVVNYAIMPAQGFDVLGHVELLIRDGKPVSLLDIEVTPAGRRAGTGRKVIETLLAANPDADLNISNIVQDARGFWERMGVPQQNLEQGAAYDGTLNWETYAQAQVANGPRAAAAQGREAGARSDARAEGTGRGAAGEAQGGLTGGGTAFSRAPKRPPKQAEALRKAGVGGPRTAREKIRAHFATAMQMIRDRNEVAQQLRQGMLDQFAGIQRAVQRDIGSLPVEQDPYVAARLANGGTSAVMRALMLHGQAQWAANGQHLEKKPGTKGLLQILEPIGEDVNDWFGWMIGNRAARLMAEGRENNFTADDIKELQALATPANKAKFQKAAVEYTAFKRSVLDVAQAAGLINAEARKVWDHADYIPFYRQIDDSAVFGATGKKGLAGQSSGIRALKGGEAALNDPMENLLMNFSRLIDASLKNNAISRTVRVLEDAGSSAVAKVGYDMKGAIVPTQQVRKLLAENGTPAPVMDAIPEEVFEGVAKMWALQAPTDPAVVRVMRDGKPQFYRVDDPLLLQALTSFVPFDFPGLGMMRAAKRLLTATVTATPEFMARNFIRDSVAAQAIGRNGFNPAKSIAGIVKSYRETGGFEAMLFAGASFQSGNVNAGNPEATGVAMRRALRAKGFDASSVGAFMGTVLDTPARFWDRYREIGEAIENANREAVYEATMSQVEIVNGQPVDMRTRAAYEAKDIMDFNLRGSWAAYQLLADVLPFFNARVQGLYRMGRSDPKRLATVGMMLMTASLMLAMANDGEDWYEELPDWDKDTYWHFKISSQHFRVPKPFEIGLIFATIPERLGRSIKGLDSGKKTVSRLWAGVRDTLAFDPVPQLGRPVLNVWANKDTFRDSPIETLSDEGKLPHLRYSARTSDTMRALADVAAPISDATGLSPKRMEYLIGGYFGTIGLYALAVSDAVVRELEGKPPGPTLRMDDLPLVRSFYRMDPARATVFESDLYDMREDVEAIYRSIRSSMRDNPEEAKRLLEEEKAKIAVRGIVVGAARQMAALNRERDMIYADRTMDPDEKRRRVDALQQQKNAIAKAAATDKRVKEAF